jgi:hypothetical protein
MCALSGHLSISDAAYAPKYSSWIVMAHAIAHHCLTITERTGFLAIGMTCPPNGPMWIAQLTNHTQCLIGRMLEEQDRRGLPPLLPITASQSAEPNVLSLVAGSTPAAPESPLSQLSAGEMQVTQKAAGEFIQTSGVMSQCGFSKEVSRVVIS